MSDAAAPSRRSIEPRVFALVFVELARLWDLARIPGNIPIPALVGLA